MGDWPFHAHSLFLNPIRMHSVPLYTNSLILSSQSQLQAAGPLPSEPFLQPWGNHVLSRELIASAHNPKLDIHTPHLPDPGRRRQRWRDIPPSPDGQASSSLLIPSHPTSIAPPPPPVSFPAPSCVFFWAYKGSVNRHYILALLGPGYMQEMRKANCSLLFTDLCFLSLSVPTPCPHSLSL